MAGLEPRSVGVGSNRSVNCVTTTVLLKIEFGSGAQWYFSHAWQYPTSLYSYRFSAMWDFQYFSLAVITLIADSNEASKIKHSLMTSSIWAFKWIVQALVMCQILTGLINNFNKHQFSKVFLPCTNTIQKLVEQS